VDFLTYMMQELLACAFAACAFTVALWIRYGYGGLLDLLLNHNYRPDGKKIESLRPVSFPFGSLLDMMNNPEKTRDRMIEIARRNGGMVVVWEAFSPVVYAFDLKHINLMWNTDFTLNKTDRSLLPSLRTKLLLGNSLFTLDVARWRHLHKIILRAGFGSRHLRGVFPAVCDGGDRIWMKIDKAVQRALSESKKNHVEALGLELNPGIELHPFCREFAISTITSVIFGDAIDEKQGLRLGELVDFFVRKGVNNPLYAIPGATYIPFGESRKVMQTIREIQAIGDVLIQQRSEREAREEVKRDAGDDADGPSRRVGDGPASTSIFDNLKAEAEKGNLSYDEVLDNVYGLMAAGFDTTANAISLSVTMLSLHPVVQMKVRKEIQAALGKGDGSCKDLTYDVVMSSTDLPYLNAVIKETLRMLPPAVKLPARILKRRTEVNGFSLQRGSEISTMQYQTSAMKEHWGGNAKHFYPERFLGEGGVSVECVKGGRFSSFGLGIRSCIGKNLAIMCVKVFLVNLLTRFEISMASHHSRRNWYETTHEFWNMRCVSYM